MTDTMMRIMYDVIHYGHTTVVKVREVDAVIKLKEAGLIKTEPLGTGVLVKLWTA